MSKTNEYTVDFSNLDQETETDGPGDRDFSFDDIIDDSILQPHLSLPPPPSTASRRNIRERGVVDVDEERAAQNLSADQTVSQSDGNNAAVVVEENEQTFDHNSNHVGNDNDNVPNGSTPTPTPNATNESHAPSNGTGTQPSSVQICYSKDTGNISVRDGQVAVTTRPDGSRYIATQQIPEQWNEDERRPLKKKRIRWIKLFSIVACVLFFPTGLPALYFAFRIQKEFEEGILRGNIDRAQKFATRSERLIILSIVMSLLTAALVVTLIERPHFQSEHFHNGGTVTG